MMNFMSGNPGFYEEMGAAGRAMSSSSSSPSSSVHHRGGAGPLSSPTNNDDSDDLMLLRQQGTVGGEGGGGSSNGTTVLEREHMFDKVVTPSDVGKLNRLVIPKQHAEKYFPLDSSNNEKGLLLNFEDRNGKPWRFRYSYWNSSQSYVMTKGWSRFVKEKKLDAGDIVSFQRGVGELGKDRLFIDWRRRPDAPDMHHYPSSLIPHHHFSSFQRSYNSMNQPWNPLYLQQQPSSLMLHNHHQSQQYHHHHHPYGGGGGGPSYSYNTVVNGNPCPPGSIVYIRSGPQGGGGGVLSGGPQHQVGVGMGVVHHMSSATTNHEPVEEQMVFDSVPVVQGKAAAKRLRLFGVNMDCPISESDECDILSTTTSTTTIPFHHLPHPNSPNYSSSSSQFIMQPNSNYSEEEKGKGTTTSMSLDLDI